MTLSPLIETRTPIAKCTYPKSGVSSPKDSQKVNQILVFQIKFCGKCTAPLVAKFDKKHLKKELI